MKAQLTLRSRVCTATYPEHWNAAICRAGYDGQRIRYTLTMLMNKLTQHNVDVIKLRNKSLHLICLTLRLLMQNNSTFSVTIISFYPFLLLEFAKKARDPIVILCLKNMLPENESYVLGCRYFWICVYLMITVVLLGLWVMNSKSVFDTLWSFFYFV